MPTKALTKTALLQTIAQETDTDRKTAAFFLDVITGIALREVKKAGEFTFPGIGKLVKQKRKARMARNQRTGQSIKEDRGEVQGVEEGEGCGVGWEVGGYKGCILLPAL